MKMGETRSTVTDHDGVQSVSASAPVTQRESLATTVRAVLGETPYVPPGAIDVDVKDHIVHLSGTVAWEHQRLAAEQAVERIPGVHVVRNSLRVRPRCSADELESKARDALATLQCAEPHQIAADVDGGTVRLTGSVCSYTEWLEASRAVRTQPSVDSVRNDVLIRRPKTS